MKLKRIYTIFILAPAVFFISCLGSGSELELSSDPSFVSLIFLRNDSIPGQERAVFRLEFDAEFNDTIIVNLDSLPFGTRIDSVFPIFQFRSTYFAMLFQENIEEQRIDTVVLLGNTASVRNDTINFTLPTWVQNKAADTDSTRTYRIKVNVHQVDPELYVWRELKDRITASAGRNQRAVFFGNRYLFYVGNDTENLLYAADDSILTAQSQWIQQTTLNFTPAPDLLKLRNIVEHQRKLYVTDNQNRLYSSDNGENWNLVNHDLTDGEIYNLLFSMNDLLWAIVKTNTDEYRLAFSENAEQWTDWGKLPDRDIRLFPTDNYASLVFRSPVGRPKVIIVGGTDREGGLIHANWIGQTDLRSGEMVFEPLPVRPNQLPPMRNASLILYDDKIMLFGGLESNGNIIPLRESRNEGLTWNVPDSAFNVRPDAFSARSYQSVIVNKSDRRIFLIGGQSDAYGLSFSDVWSVKLNRMYWATR